MKLKQCFFCNKLKFTPYHITEIHPGEIETYDMCKECGWEFVKEAYEPKQNSKDEPEVAVIKTPQELLSLLLGVTPVSPTKPTKPDCVCGMSAAELEKRGRFGCPQCYEHFHEYIEQLVLPYHGAEEHIGKRPRKQTSVVAVANDEERLKLLKLRLAQAIELEKYEQAGEIHAEIKALTDPEPHPSSSDQ